MKTNETNETTNELTKVLDILPGALDALKTGIHDGNVQRGFYDKEPSVCEQLALIMTEGAEAIEADRKNKHADIKTFRKKVLELDPDDPEYKTKFDDLFRTYIKDTVEDELADIFIRLMDFCGWRNVNITEHVLLKVNYNNSRPYKHGKQY